MKSRKYITLSLFCLVFYTVATAQQFKMKQAEQYFQQTHYAKAIPLYEDLIKKEQTLEIIQHLADSYYFTFQIDQAAKYYSLIERKYPEQLDNELLFRFIQVSKAQNNYEKARLLSLELYPSKKAKKEVTYLENVKAIGNRFNIKNLQSVNTEGSEFGVSIHRKNLIYAASSSQKGLFNKLFYWNNTPYLNLYKIPLSDSLKKNEKKHFAKELTTRFHESNAVFSHDAKTVYFTRNNYLNGKKTKDTNRVTQLQIYRAELKDERWQNVISLPINSDHYSTEHPALSPDGKTLYFSSNKPGGFGSFDLYKVNTTDFKNPQNLGANINTPHKEQFPFIDKEGNLFFASDGHPGFGFLDIHVAKADEKGFKKPDNIGLPINSGYDDFAYYENDDSKTGYFSSNRPVGKGSDDIYKFIEKKALIIEDCYQYITGVITDKNTTALLENAEVQLLVNDSLIKNVLTPQDASYRFKVDCGKVYTLIGSKKAYQNDTITVATTHVRKKEIVANLALMSKKKLLEIEQEKIALATKQRQEQEKAKKLAFEKAQREKQKAKDKRIDQIVKEEKSIIKEPKTNRFLIKTEPIYFDYDLWYIRKESREVLSKVIAMLKKYPDMTLEIGTHTDIRGNNKYNRKLSQKRANSVMNYFEEEGINRHRIVAKGYGESQPIIHCKTEDDCTEEQHEINRRCEFVILSFE